MEKADEPADRSALEGVRRRTRREGRYASADEVFSEGLRLVEEREKKRKALRDHLNAAIERGGSYTDEEVMASVERVFAA